SVQTNAQIPEEWTHIAATFDSNTISIFVNGINQNTNPITGIPTLSLSGKLETTTLNSITSEKEIIIGAYINTKKGLDDPLNKFSGEIDNVDLFDSMLT